MELNHFTETFTVLNADGDFRRMLKPSALFRYVEQAAADHARAYGMDDAFFAARHTAFLVGKQAVEIYRMPTRGEKVTPRRSASCASPVGAPPTTKMIRWKGSCPSSCTKRRT